MILKEHKMTKIIVLSDFESKLITIDKKNVDNKREIIDLQDYKKRKALSDEEFVRMVINKAKGDYNFTRRVVNGI
jgi:hypothetical protein